MITFVKVNFYIFVPINLLNVIFMEITIKEIKHSDEKKFSVTLFDPVSGFCNTRVIDDSKTLLFYLNFWL